jgi:acetyltransferase-like isoleucine patch superfamily enzyme
MKLNRLCSRLVRGLWYFPKTLYLNFKVLPVKKAVKLPFVVMGHCCLRGVNSKSVKLEGPVHRFMIHFGTQKTAKRGLPVNRTTYVLIDSGGTIIFKGGATFAKGSSICASGGTIVFGDRFSCNVNCFFYCKKHIEFGTDDLLGWDIKIRDNDGHPMYDREHVRINPDADIVFGDHVWVGSYADILKGVSIADGTVIATRSLVTKSNCEENAVIAGVPAKVVKRDVFWEHDV